MSSVSCNVSSSVPSSVPSFVIPPTHSLEQPQASGRTDTGPISHHFRDARPDDTPPTSTMQSRNSIVDGINQSPLFAAATPAVAPFFTGVRAGARVYHFAELSSGDLLVPMLVPQQGGAPVARLTPVCRRWLELNLLHDSEVQARRSSTDPRVRATVLLNCHNHRGRLCWHQRDSRCDRAQCNFIHIDYRATVSAEAAMQAFHRLAHTLAPPALAPIVPAPMMPVQHPMMMVPPHMMVPHRRVVVMAPPHPMMVPPQVFIPAAAPNSVAPAVAVARAAETPERVIPEPEVPPVQYVDDAPTLASIVATTPAVVAPAVVAPAVVAMPPARHIIRVRKNNYAFDVRDGKLVMRFKIRADPRVQTHLVCREWLENGLKELNDPTRKDPSVLPCASTHAHPGNWMMPCLFNLAHMCTRPAGTCRGAHIIAEKVNDDTLPMPAAPQALPTTDDFVSLSRSENVARPASWVAGGDAAAVMAAPAATVPRDAVVMAAPVARLNEETKVRDQRHTQWCNGSDKCPGFEKCAFIHPETAHLARMDPRLPERIAFRADLVNGKIDFDGRYVMVYEALRKNIETVRLIHNTSGAHRSNFHVFLNDDLVGQIERLETVEFGSLLSLWRSMINVVRSDKTVEKLKLADDLTRTNEDGTKSTIDFALSTGRDSRAEQHVLALAALTRTCFPNKYGDLMCFVARFAADKKTELGAFDEDVLKKFSGYCIPKKRDVCLATSWCCHHGGHVSTSGKAVDGSIVTLAGLNGDSICDANETILAKAKAVRAELYARFTACQLEALRINQDIKDEEKSTGFKNVAREATSARDKLATDRAKAIKEARDCTESIAMAQDRLTRHADALTKVPKLELKLAVSELKLRKLLGRVKMANLATRLEEDTKVLNKAETALRRLNADINQTTGRIAKSKATNGDAGREDTLAKQLSDLEAQKPGMESELEQAKMCLADNQVRAEELKQKMAVVVAELAAHQQQMDVALIELTKDGKKDHSAFDAWLMEQVNALENENSVLTIPLERVVSAIKDLAQMRNPPKAHKASKAFVLFDDEEEDEQSSSEMPAETYNAEVARIISTIASFEDKYATEKMFTVRLVKEQSALQANKQFILKSSVITGLELEIAELTQKRDAAVKLAAILKTEFESASEHANAEVRAAEEMYAQMMEGRDIVKEARAKAKAARDATDAFRKSMEDRIEHYRAQLPELNALLEPLRAQRKHAKEQGLDAALIAKIEAQGNPIIKDLKAVRASIAKLVEEKDDEDSDYNVQLAKLAREAARLEAEASQVLSGEALRERITANTRTARLRALQTPVSVIEADLSDGPAISTVRQSGANGRSRVFVWKHGQQERSLEDRFEALEEMVAKARSAHVASVPWLGHMLKQVQQLIIEARGTNALCPVAHYGYKQLDVAGCMMQLKQIFESSIGEVSQTKFEFNLADFASIAEGLERAPIMEHTELAAIKGPFVHVPKAKSATTTTGIISRGLARRRRRQEEQEEMDFERSEVIVGRKAATHADINASHSKSLLAATPKDEAAEAWAMAWAAENIWAEVQTAEVEKRMTAKEQKEADIAATVAKQNARIAEKEAKAKAAKQAKKESDKATKAKIQAAKDEAATVEKAQMTKAERTRMVESAMESLKMVLSADDKVFLEMGPTSASISMVELYTGKTCEIKRKSVELKTMAIGPLPVLACAAISERFIKTGVRSSTVERDGAWFIEFDSTSVQSEQEQRSRVSIVLEELIQHDCFPAADDIATKFHVKLSVPAPQQKKRKQEKTARGRFLAPTVKF